MVFLQVLMKSLQWQNCIAKIMYSTVTNCDELLRVVNICTLFWVFGVINTPHKTEQSTKTLRLVKEKTTPEKAILVLGNPTQPLCSLQEN